MTKKQKQIQKTKQRSFYKKASIASVLFISVSFGGYYAVASALPQSTNMQIAMAGGAQVALKSVSGSALTNSSTIKAAEIAASQVAAAKAAAAKATAQAAATAQTSAKPANVATNVSKGSALYVVPERAAAIQQAANNSGSASDAAVLNRLATQPTAQWFGDWNTDVRSAVNQAVSGARSAGKVAVLVAYNVPNRDCGGESAGGSGNASTYANWIRQFGAGIGGRASIVVLEPDAIAADCFTASRAAMISDAASALQASGASVYIDAGNANWRSTADTANRLKQSGIASASGFSLNVSNFQTTSANINYGSAVSNQIGGKHFVIDTSRNGNGPTSDSQWCNPAGRAIGQSPTTQTGYSLVDAFLWIKVPGESDGRCGPAIGSSQPPSAGQFWPEYALMLARNAGW